MTHISVKTVRAGLVTALVLLACAVPAQAGAGHSAEDAGDSWLMLTVSHGGTQSAARGGTMLRCDPPGGDHRHAAAACAELAAANGHVSDIPKKYVDCPEVFAPVTAHAQGKWRGRQVEYSGTFSNTCVLNARTGSVFALDEA
ncbi:SSI family serine proteinase inhibitor [Streptomyces sp. NPDC017966]|uniref:SSI family serine proteinase inhibitor n=1 Tax=Streptomyces sp. NPDC017966 TaxID=3365023 RepID=UPI00379773F5